MTPLEPLLRQRKRAFRLIIQIFGANEDTYLKLLDLLVDFEDELKYPPQVMSVINKLEANEPELITY